MLLYDLEVFHQKVFNHSSKHCWTTNFILRKYKMLSRVLIISTITGSHAPEQAEQVNIIFRHLTARGNDAILNGKFYKNILSVLKQTCKLNSHNCTTILLFYFHLTILNLGFCMNLFFHFYNIYSNLLFVSFSTDFLAGLN